MNKNFWIGLSIILILLLVVGFLVLQKMRKWKCTETGCEKDFGGNYSSESDCKKKCNEKKEVIFSEPLEVIIPQELDEYDTYACTSDYRCVKTKDGDFTNLQSCQTNCQVPYTETQYVYPYYSYPYYSYYPQSLSYYPRRRHRRRPWRWSPGGRMPGGGGRRSPRIGGGGRRSPRIGGGGRRR